MSTVTTISYYETHAPDYANKTQSVDMAKVYNRFLNHIPPGGKILDAGSGSGRDTLAFLGRDYQVDALDASPRLAALSTQLTGVPTKVLRFQELDIVSRYDGVWACASLLHLKASELVDAFARLQRALNPNGIIYASFKVGTEERVAVDGRWFTDMNEERLHHILKDVPKLTLVDIWLSAGEDTFYGQGEWLNVLLRNNP
jgi:SAM-dependent methyltransferase